MNDKSRTALITGASSGIGYELTKLFAADGYDLIIVARSEEKLEQLKTELSEAYAIKVNVIAKDLSRPGAADEIYNLVDKAGIFVDVLVNNAGFGLHGSFAGTDLQRELDMIQVNISALTHLTKLFIKEMVKRQSGRILNVASTAAFMAGPLMAVYYATKAYVLSFSEALHKEFKDQGIYVSALCPGPTDTAFVSTAEIDNSRLFNSGLLRILSAGRVARIGYKGLMKNKPVIITGFMNRLTIQMLRLLPRAIVRSATKWIMDRR